MINACLNTIIWLHVYVHTLNICSFSFSLSQDLVNTCRTTIKKLTEVVLLYYALEICQLVEALHSCGIIHADIKPDNIMLRDIRYWSRKFTSHFNLFYAYDNFKFFNACVQCPHLFIYFCFFIVFYFIIFYRPVTDYSSIRGRGVCLLDFGRAIDVQSFPRGTQFIGSCGTDSFQCTQMLNQEPWSWHVRYLILYTVHAYKMISFISESVH